MEIDRKDGRTANQLRPLTCTRNVLNRAHGSASWSQGETKVVAAVYGPKAGTNKNENPEKACFEVIWKPKTGQIGKAEKEYEMILKRTVQSICVLNVYPNTTTSIIIQVVNDDGALLPCAINALCAALVDAGIPLKHLGVAICCSLAESGHILLDSSKLEEQKMKAFVYLVFPNSILSVLPESSKVKDEPMEHGLITSFTHGVMSVDDYLRCLERGRAATAKLSDFLRRSLLSQVQSDSSKLDHILLETAGLANPAPLASVLWLDDQLESDVRLDSIITVRIWLEELLWDKKYGMDVYRSKGILRVRNSDELHTLQGVREIYEIVPSRK